MPRKAKEKVDEIEKKDVKKNVVKKAASKTKASTEKTKAKSTAKAAKSTSTKKATPKKAETKTSAKKTEAKTSTKKTETKSATKKTATKSEAKSTAKKTTTKSTTKSATKKTATKSATKSAAKKTAAKSTAKKSTIKKEKEPIQILEYYDLPYKYGNTVVRLLAQTPKTLFVYWEVSDSDIDNFKKVYGEDFYNKTKPILIVHNLTLNKTYEVEINDFANCWYLNTDDTDCKFDIELARKFITNPQSQNDYAEYLYVAQSNNLQSPNDHILFEKLKEFVVFKDVNNNKKTKKDIKSFKFLRDIYKFYKDMYDEDILNNPSSQFKF